MTASSPRVKAIYVTSYYENPSTVTLSLARRAAIVEIAKRWSRHGPIYVIDDAAYRELRYAGDDLPSLRSFDDEGDTVIVAETFSKIVTRPACAWAGESCRRRCWSDSRC